MNGLLYDISKPNPSRMDGHITKHQPENPATYYFNLPENFRNSFIQRSFLWKMMRATFQSRDNIIQGSIIFTEMETKRLQLIFYSSKKGDKQYETINSY